MDDATRTRDAVRADLARYADPDRGERMRRYLRSAMPCLGVGLPAVRRVVRRVDDDAPLADRAGFTRAVLLLWREAEHREERYAATALSRLRRYEAFGHGPAMLGLHEEMVVTGAWWDLVDEVAIHGVGPVLRAWPRETTPRVLAWCTSRDRWLRRTAVICQVGSGAATDTALLSASVEANADDPDFFLRKGIGWALRQHARHDPAWVIAFLADHPGLSPLSRREASKHLG